MLGGKMSNQISFTNASPQRATTQIATPQVFPVSVPCKHSWSTPGGGTCWSSPFLLWDHFQQCSGLHAVPDIQRRSSAWVERVLSCRLSLWFWTAFYLLIFWEWRAPNWSAWVLMSHLPCFGFQGLYPMMLKGPYGSKTKGWGMSCEICAWTTIWFLSIISRLFFWGVGQTWWGLGITVECEWGWGWGILRDYIGCLEWNRSSKVQGKYSPSVLINCFLRLFPISFKHSSMKLIVWETKKWLMLCLCCYPTFF